MVARDGDQLVVTKLDRLGRSLEHLITLSRGLQERDVDLVVLDQGIDTSTAVGRMFFQILGAIAEFEQALMSERTMDGLAAARARGRTAGRSPSSPRARPASPSRCMARPARTGSAATPWHRSPPSSASAAPPFTGILHVCHQPRKGPDGLNDVARPGRHRRHASRHGCWSGGALGAARVTSRGQADLEEQKARRQAYSVCATALLARRDAVVALLETFPEDVFDQAAAQVQSQNLDEQRAAVARAVGAVAVEGPYAVAHSAEYAPTQSRFWPDGSATGLPPSLAVKAVRSWSRVRCATAARTSARCSRTSTTSPPSAAKRCTPPRAADRRAGCGRGGNRGAVLGSQDGRS